MHTEYSTMPALWAPYLLHGDITGLSAHEHACCDAFLDRQKIAKVLGFEGYPYFSRFYGRLHGEATGGGMLLDHVVTVAIETDKTLKSHES